MKIIVFSDVHYFADDIETAIFNTKEKLVKYALPMLDKLTEKINNEHKADLSVNLGDIIQDTTKHDDDIEALKFMFRRLKAIKCPCYSLLGNHDLKMMDSVEEVEELLGYKTTHSLDVGGFHLVFLTTEVRPELGTERGGCYKAQYLSESDLKWLEEDMKNNTLPCLIFTHYALAEDESIQDECMFMKNRAEVKEIIKRSKNVKAVFSGHQHISKRLTEDGIDYHIVDSMIANSGISDEPRGTYLEIDTDGGEITVNTRRITVKELSV